MCPIDAVRSLASSKLDHLAPRKREAEQSALRTFCLINRSSYVNRFWISAKAEHRTLSNFELHACQVRELNFRGRKVESREKNKIEGNRFEVCLVKTDNFLIFRDWAWKSGSFEIKHFNTCKFKKISSPNLETLEISMVESQKVFMISQFELY